MTTTTTLTATPTTPEEREALRQLAEKVVTELLTTCTVVGHTTSGRVKVVHATTPGPATAEWRRLRATLTA